MNFIRHSNAMNKEKWKERTDAFVGQSVSRTPQAHNNIHNSHNTGESLFSRKCH